MRIVARPSCVAVLCLVASVLLRAATSGAWQIGDSAGDRTLAAAAAEWDLRRLSGRELQTLLRNASGESGAAECCPSRMDMVMPGGGIRVDGLYVELFQLQEQSFYEVSCLDSVRDKPCRFIDRRLQAQSRCVQKYSYSYALVREEPPRHSRRGAHAHAHRNDSWRMDYIRVRSGCACEIVPKAQKKRQAAKKGKRRRPGGGGGAAAGAGADDPPTPAPAPAPDAP
ncbi:hypothetical protein R5R35_008120 [Gryllus longicercus]|uniref:Uncharacterized protein n=1 Tax=Gryllus longicercus TaxID=2509291 RepID=A0AAN9VC78_9ORTH